MSEDVMNNPTRARWCRDHQQFVNPDSEGKYICSGKPERGECPHELPAKVTASRTPSWGC